jgi:serine/threonine protein kinase
MPGDDTKAPSGTRIGTPRPARPSAAPAAEPHPPPARHEAPVEDAFTQPAQSPGIAGLVPGMRIHQYELIRELGRGGMGVVFAARDTKLGRRVAMKFLHAPTREVTERFLTEARATAQCQHDNIVIIHAVDEHAGMPYMVLEFLEGQPLRAIMGPFGEGVKLPGTRTIELALPIARALARAHELGIVHRDLKPENVVVTHAGQVKVLDFGIAKALAERRPASRPSASERDSLRSIAPLDLTQEGAMVGTLPYMSPEQMGIDAVDHRADIWALGIMLFEMLAGRHPVEPLTSDALLANGTSATPLPSLAKVAPELPHELVQLVDSCLRKAKAERADDARELARKLEELLPDRRGRALAEGESPYPGLTAFQETDADRFFGRSRDVGRMVARIRELPLTGIVGPSGVGKSSFIRAGVGPALKAGERWEIVTLRPGRQPLAALASVIERLSTAGGVQTAVEYAAHRDVVRQLRSEPGLVGEKLRARAHQIGGHLLLFVDQLEELYTLVPDPAERQAFTAALAGAADDTAAPVRVVVSMRSDFVDRVGEDPRFLEELSRGLAFLSPPDRQGLRDAIVQPIELVGYRFESDQMVEDMLHALDGMPGALPLLQFAAAKLWDARDRTRMLLTGDSYLAIGGISGALATHADEVVAQMNASAQKLAQRIFRRLVTPERTRAILELADLHDLAPDRGEVARVIDQLVAARLLVVQTRADAGGGSVELVHESLIERWPTLRRWLDEDQEDAAFLAQLAAAAKQWDAKGRPSGLLWRGDAMEEARLWYTQRPRELAERDQAFLDAVLALARRKRRQRTVVLATVLAVLGLVAAGASVAFVLVRGAERDARAALAQAKRAEAQRKEAEAAIKRARDDFDDAEAAKDKARQDAASAATEAERASAQARAAQAEKQQVEAQKRLADGQKMKAEADMQNALVEKQRAEDEMQAAEAARHKAEAERQRAEAARARAEADRRRALQEAQKAEQEVKQVGDEAAQTRDQLQQQNTKLESALKAMTAERDREHASAADLDAARRHLQQLTDQQRDEIRRLQERLSHASRAPQ